MVPFSQAVPVSAVGIFLHPNVARVSKLQEMPTLSSGSFLFIRPHQVSAALTQELAPPKCFEASQTREAPAVSDSVPHLPSLLQMFCS